MQKKRLTKNLKQNALLLFIDMILLRAVSRIQMMLKY